MKIKTGITAAMRYAIVLTFIASSAMKTVNLDATAETVRGYCNLLGFPVPEIPFFRLGAIIAVFTCTRKSTTLSGIMERV